MKVSEMEGLMPMMPSELAMRKDFFIYFEGVSEETLRLDFIEKDFLSYYFLIGIKYSTRYWFPVCDKTSPFMEKLFIKLYGSEEKLLLKRAPLLEKTRMALNSINDIREYQNRGIDTEKDVMELITTQKQYLLAIYEMLEFEFGLGTFSPKIDYLGEFEEWKKDVKLNGLK
ncbi:hypothetical protein GJV85_07795 [Sulfurimonas aquatica]|uniref:Uncharacterized protein n=1 Tax=Sulfurimonas aquatica TaxID=2672570 RepID=A0A975B0L6_9BACT|nr:hypothetical protein [Sulfurimonas aquatica]QSZ42014.1 hypothetical protein GJV85_07795 [Sulfurimonas aquatica]